MLRTPRTLVLATLGLMLVVAGLGAGTLLLFHGERPPPTTASLPTPPSSPAAPVVTPPAPTAAAPTPATAPVAPAEAPSAPSPAPPPALPPLPSVEVSEQPANPVPSGATPMPAVTIEGKNGHTVTRPGASIRSDAAEPPPAAPAPVSPPRQSASLTPPGAILVGPAAATGTISLAMQGYGIRLYAIAPPAAGDRCASARGEAETCSEVTRQVLAERLAHSASVTCRLPADAKPGELGRLCMDGSGTDIAGYLVSAGLALADPRQARDYVGAESIAKTYRRGLWAYR